MKNIKRLGLVYTSINIPTTSTICRYNNLQKVQFSSNMFSSKEAYIMSKWQVDFPSHATLSYKDVSGLSSRSRDIGLWFKEASDEFNLYKTAPEWFIAAGKDMSSWTEEVQSKYVYIKELNREISSEMNRISLEAKKKMRDIEDKHKDRLISELRNTPELVIELINSTMLPYEVHIQSFEFNTKEEASNFISEELRKFKLNTYCRYLEGKLSADDLINMLFAKR